MPENLNQLNESLENIVIGVIGLGYVGLPLAIEFGKKRQTIGFDINQTRIDELNKGKDRTQEVNAEELKASSNLTITSSIEELSKATFFIVTVPTPIDESKQPDLSPLRSASKMIGGILKKGDFVVYESTVYPGATQEVCQPILEKMSSLIAKKDFYLGYSPERINPGDKLHRVTDIVKVTSGCCDYSANIVDAIYKEIIVAGTHKASSIPVAEAAKVIENTQRDLNIALINELAMIFDRLNIDTHEVLAAAGTKWNFLPFKPGLVGGHCIGVDPYYLTHKAQTIGYHPEIILAGRRINDNMGPYIASQIVKKLAQRKINIVGSKLLILGMTFKENCPDIRNTRVIDVINELKTYNTIIDVFDPWADPNETEHEYGIRTIESLDEVTSSATLKTYDCCILTVGHQEFLDLGTAHIRSLMSSNGLLFDVKGVFPANEVDARL